MFERFQTRAQAVSAEVHRFPAAAQALDFICDFVNKEGQAVWADCPFDRETLARAAPGLRFDVTREAAAEARAGISTMEWGIAGTGSLLQDATAVEQRLVSSLPMIHIALLATDRIVPDLAAALAKVRPEQTGYIAIITGPSRTADIERVLTIGVHGPERLVILCVDDMDGQGAR